MVADVTLSDPERTIRLEAVFNFRDVGGYPVDGGGRLRRRTLYRADGLNRLTEPEAEELRSLGLVTVIDLRTPDEVARGRVPDALGATRYHHLPMFDVVPDWSTAPDIASPDFLAHRYLEMLETGRAAVATTFGLLAAAGTLPAVFHCAAGKDRTGIVAALLLELLGVERELVVADYALSHAAMERMEEWLAVTHPDWAASRPAAVIEARPETMDRFLAAVDDRFGSVSRLVADLGVDNDTVTALRDALLEG